MGILTEKIQTAGFEKTGIKLYVKTLFDIKLKQILNKLNSYFVYLKNKLPY